MGPLFQLIWKAIAKIANTNHDITAGVLVMTLHKNREQQLIQIQIQIQTFKFSSQNALEIVMNLQKVSNATPCKEEPKRPSLFRMMSFNGLLNMLIKSLVSIDSYHYPITIPFLLILSKIVSS